MTVVGLRPLFGLRTRGKADLILALALRRLAPKRIALALDLPVETVRNTIYDLRARGFPIPLRRNLRGSRPPVAAGRNWCPAEHRATYRTLRAKVGAAEARRLVERDLLRRRAA